MRRPGDWRVKHSESHRYTEPNKPVGAWFFEYDNEFYPDVDDTAMVLMALNRVSTEFDREKFAAIRRGTRWVLGMQGKDGGWASFDKDNDKWLFTQVPFADHNAMIDSSTSDITARVLESLGHFGFTMEDECVQKAIRFLKRDQCADGSWFGRWGTNYIYGSWQVLRGLHLIGEDMRLPYVRRAVAWLKSSQNADGGWGESLRSYDDTQFKGIGKSTASQTAWALMGLISANEVNSPGSRPRHHTTCSTNRNSMAGGTSNCSPAPVSPRVLSPLPLLPSLFPAHGVGDVRAPSIAGLPARAARTRKITCHPVILQTAAHPQESGALARVGAFNRSLKIFENRRRPNNEIPFYAVGQDGPAHHRQQNQEDRQIRPRAPA